jgi:hypothetical protein
MLSGSVSVSTAVVIDRPDEVVRAPKSTGERFPIVQKKHNLLFFAEFKTRLEHI